MFGNIKNMAEIIKMAGQAKQTMAKLQEELEHKTVEAESGGGAVRVIMSGKGRIVDLQLDPNLLPAIAGDDKQIVEELITSACNAAAEKVQQLMLQTLGQSFTGMDIPPGLTGLGR